MPTSRCSAFQFDTLTGPSTEKAVAELKKVGEKIDSKEAEIKDEKAEVEPQAEQVGKVFSFALSCRFCWWEGRVRVSLVEQ
jgi:hypothetical protein